MKKIYIALAVLATLFIASPSMALVGTPDAVPGTNILQPFFVVSFDGMLDTLVTLTEVKGVRASTHWQMRDKESNHVGNGDLPYTPYDVIPLSIRQMLTHISATGLESLEVDLNGDGVMDHWMGYMEYDNNWAWRPGVDGVVPMLINGVLNPLWRNVNTYDNLIGHMYVIALLDGLASGVVLPGRELANRNDNTPLHGGAGWWLEQNSYLSDAWLPPAGTMPFPEFTDYEAFTAFAYATSKARENGFNPHTASGVLPIPAYFRLLPRYFLLNDTAETFFFIWSSGNWGRWEQGGLFDPDTYKLVVNIWNEEELGYSGQINVPYELNFVDIRTMLPSSWAAPIGGWVDIRWDFDRNESPITGWDYPWYYSAIPLAAEWLGYSYQFASSPNATLNWGTLFEMHRDVGTFVIGFP